MLKKRLKTKEIRSNMMKCRRVNRRTGIKIRRKNIIKRMVIYGKVEGETDRWLGRHSEIWH